MQGRSVEKTFFFRILALFLLMLPVTDVSGGSLSIHCGRTTVGLNEEFVVRLTYQGDDNFSGRFAISRNSFFHIAEGGISQSMSFGYSSGGASQQRRMNSRDYVLRARRLGVYTIGPGYYTVGGRRYSSRTIRIQVVRNAPRQSGQNFHSNFRRSFRFSFGAEDDNDEQLKLMADSGVTPVKPYVSQMVTLYLDVYASSSTRLVPRLLIPPMPGFWVEQIKHRMKAYPDEVTIKGKKWHKYRLELARLYPASSGTHTIPPIKGMLITTGFFGQRFNFETKKLSVTSRPLPETGKPVGFSGIVGSYRISMEPMEGTPATGEPYQIAVTVTGKGLLQSVTELTIESGTNDFRILAPRVVAGDPRGDQVTNARRFLYTVYPRKAGDIRLPVFSLNFFEPESGRYRKVRTAVTNVSVARGHDTGAGSGMKPDDSAAPLVYTTDRDRTMLPFSRTAYLVIFPLLALVSLLNLFLMRRKMALEDDPAAGRRVSAKSLAASRLAQASRILKNGDLDGALSLMEKAVKGYATDKLGIPGGSILYTTLQERMNGIGIPADLVSDFISHCSAIGELRYGGMAALPECTALLEASRTMVSRLRREWP